MSKFIATFMVLSGTAVCIGVWAGSWAAASAAAGVLFTIDMWVLRLSRRDP